MELQPKVTFDRQSGFRGFEKREQGAERDFALFFFEEQGKLRFLVNPGSALDKGEMWLGDLAIDRNRLHGEIQRCRQVWRDAVIMFQKDGVYPFQKYWDLSGHADIVDTAVAQIALAGRVLFEHLFFPKTLPVNFDAKHRERLNRIGTMFEENPQSMRIRVTSDVAYVPWNLLYSGPIENWVTGEGATLHRFWGYQHEIEHTPRETNATASFGLEPPVAVSMQLDERIDTQFKVPCNADVIAMFKAFDGIDLRPHNRRKELATHFSKPVLDERVFYFCCHATGITEHVKDKPPIVDKSDAFLTLTDGTPIKAAELDQWLTNTTFDGRPVVFLNACQSAHMNFIFHQGFAPIFLRCGASSVIGAQTEVPPVFASRFAQQFFCAFLTAKGRVGDILLELHRNYADQYRNPLGLLYSVYHGADVYMQKPLNRVAPIGACDDSVPAGE